MRQVLTTILLLVCAILPVACNKDRPSGSVTQGAQATPPTQSTPSTGGEPKGEANAQPDDKPQGPVVKDELGLPVGPPGDPVKLIGAYTVTEVHQNGVVTMIPHEVATQITFLPDGTFSRTSKAQNKVNFKDSGQFVIEGKNQLILKIIMWRGKIQQPAVEKRHTFELSADGSELRLTGSDGKVGIFRR